jgi:hypothetical protein
MNLDDKFAPIRDGIYDLVGNVFKLMAKPFGYPENLGMTTIYQLPSEFYARAQFMENLPKHQTFWPPMQKPETWFEMFFGPVPKPDVVKRILYESKGEGFYNFYIENFRNTYYLPDWLSEFIQIRLNICLDITVLEITREFMFVGVMLFSQMLVARITIAWFLYINPYTVPWCYISAATDWTEDALQGLVPAIFGVNITSSLFISGIGKLGDSLNHLVFTMPYLRSEGEEMKLLIDERMRDILVFHYLPINWYKHPIPNDIREFWYYKRPDILKSLQEDYKNVDIQFLPNDIVEELNKAREDLDALNDFVEPVQFNEAISTQILSNEHLLSSNDFTSYISENIHTLFTNHLNNFF